MSDRKRSTASDSDLTIGPEIQPHYPFPFVLPAGTGPAQPEPEGGWKITVGTIDEPAGADEEMPAEANSGRAVGWLRRLTNRG